MKGFVYFIDAHVGVPVVKIGWTGKDPRTRLAGLQTASPVKLVLAAFMEGSQSDERKLHEVFAPLRRRGEWFEQKGKLDDFVNTMRFFRDQRRFVLEHEFETALRDTIHAQKPLEEDANVAEYMASACPECWSLPEYGK